MGYENCGILSKGFIARMGFNPLGWFDSVPFEGTEMDYIILGLSNIHQDVWNLSFYNFMKSKWFV